MPLKYSCQGIVCRERVPVESIKLSLLLQLKNMRSKISVVIMLAALGLLVPGILQPMLSLSGTVDKQAMVDIGMKTLSEDPDVPSIMISLTEQLVTQLDLSGEIPAYQKTRSIIGTVQELFEAEQWLVGFLIALFSIIIPLVKVLLMLLAKILPIQSAEVSNSIIRVISKWSMADVFVVAIIVAYLAANATRQTEELFTLTAEFGVGFYYFLGYCLLSILSMQLMMSGHKTKT